MVWLFGLCIFSCCEGRILFYSQRFSMLRSSLFPFSDVEVILGFFILISCILSLLFFPSLFVCLFWVFWGTPCDFTFFLVSFVSLEPLWPCYYFLVNETYLLEDMAPLTGYPEKKYACNFPTFYLKPFTTQSNGTSTFEPKRKIPFHPVEHVWRLRDLPPN